MNSSNSFSDQTPSRILPVHIGVSVYGAIIIFFGTVGNMLSLKIFWNSDVFKESTHLLLIVLQIADSSVLLVAVARYWIQQTLSVDIRDLGFAVCVTHVLLTYLCVDSAIWVLVLIVLDRFLAVTYPIRSRLLMTKANVLKVLLVMLALLCIKDAPLVQSHLWNATAPAGQPRCMYNREFFKYYVIVDSLLNFAVPDSLLLIFNVAIFCCLRRHARSMSRAAGDRGQDAASAAGQARKRSQDSRQRQLAVAKVALVSGTVHLITSLPSAIYLFSHSFINYSTSSSNFLLNNALMMLSYTNNAINFLIYLPIDRKFRTSFHTMVTPECSNANDFLTGNHRARQQQQQRTDEAVKQDNNGELPLMPMELK